ncbi:hypothetical protein QBC44DRAFT_370625 [Cladorrhinum sp. PSN332]|nr:hypothetical protein QBC44DRAFT_370625 [Cladorrhinum sp. PSN332]
MTSAPNMDALYQTFMTVNAGNPRAYRELQRVLTSHDKIPEQQPTQPLLPVDELEIRFELMRKLEIIWEKSFTRLTELPMSRYQPFNDMQVAALLHMDLDYLRHIVNIWDVMVLQDLQGLGCTLKIFSNKTLSAQDIRSAEAVPQGDPVFEPDVPSESSGDELEVKRKATKYEQSGTRAKRNSFYVMKRNQLDNYRCIVTQTSNPQVCHIVPFSANATEKARDLWRKCLITIVRLQLMGTTSLERLESLFCSKLGVSDRHWNSICLSPKLHDWWERGYFAFRYLGTRDPPLADPNSIVCLRIQFEWMVWRERDIGKKPAGSLGRTVAEFQAALPEYAGQTMPPHCGDYHDTHGRPLVAVSRPETGFNVEDGDVFEVVVPRRHMEKMILSFQVQRALIKILAMVGGAEALDDVDYQPPFLDEDWEFPGLKTERMGRPLVVLSGAWQGKDEIEGLDEGDSSKKGAE